MARRIERRAAVTLAILGLLLAGRSSPVTADALTPSLNPFSGAASNTPPSPTVGASHAATGAAAARCTVATIVTDIGTNDTYLFRVAFLAPDEATKPGESPVCPAGAAPEAARRALAACKQRASNPYNCVYGDMDHMFEYSTEVVDTSSDTSQCASYAARFIGVACRPGDEEDLCNVGCGNSAAEAKAAASAKCRTEHGGDCTLTNAVPVKAP